MTEPEPHSTPGVYRKVSALILKDGALLTITASAHPDVHSLPGGPDLGAYSSEILDREIHAELGVGVADSELFGRFEVVSGIDRALVKSYVYRVALDGEPRAVQPGRALRWVRPGEDVRMSTTVQAVMAAAVGEGLLDAPPPRLPEQAMPIARAVAGPDAARPDEWSVTVTVPARLPDTMKDALFTAVADAAHEWEPGDRDGWDVNVTGCPAAPEPLTLPEQAMPVAAALTGQDASSLAALGIPEDAPPLRSSIPPHQLAGYSAVWELIRSTPGDAWRNALIWRAVEAYRGASEAEHEREVRAAAVAEIEVLRDGVANPGRPYNEAFIHALDCAIRAISGDGR